MKENMTRPMVADLLTNSLESPGDALRFASVNFSQRIAVRTTSNTLTYAEFFKRVVAIATELAADGHGKNSTIISSVEDPFEAAMLRFAAWELDARVIFKSFDPDGDNKNILPFQAGGREQTNSPTSPAYSLELILQTRNYLTHLDAFEASGENAILVADPRDPNSAGFFLAAVLTGSEIQLYAQTSLIANPDLISSSKTTHMVFSPGVLIDWFDNTDIDFDRNTHLRTVHITSGPVGSSVVESAIEQFGNRLQISYHLPKSIVPVSYLNAEDIVLDGSPAPNQTLRSAGKAPSQSLKIVSHTGKELPDGNIGEILTRSATNLAYEPSGVLGYIDEEGYLQILNEADEVIHFRGHQIYPRIVETVLQAHPAVKEAYLMLDTDSDELMMCASISADATESDRAVLSQELQYFLSRWLVKWQVPSVVKCVDRLPRHVYGTVDRRACASVTQSLIALNNVG